MKGLYYNDIMRALAATDVDLEPEISAAVEELATAAYKLAEACGDYGGVYLNAKLSFFEPEDDDDPQPAPVETPRVDNSLPKTMRTFDIGQTVCVRDDVDGEASAYTGRTGQVTHLDRSRASGVVRYFTTLSKLDAFYADELEPAD